MKIIFIFSCSEMFRDLPECSGISRNVPAFPGMFRVPGFIDGRWRGPSWIVVCVCAWLKMSEKTALEEKLSEVKFVNRTSLCRFWGNRFVFPNFSVFVAHRRAEVGDKISREETSYHSCTEKENGEKGISLKYNIYLYVRWMLGFLERVIIFDALIILNEQTRLLFFSDFAYPLLGQIFRFWWLCDGKKRDKRRPCRRH